ncbi:Nre family DNA repair protein [Pyrobaculum calidifontis]|uniref:DNA repair protein n=1 Tax=Pyrobaculum calidifontis (strain DSM 21063 / JCM 11548 / VA1) TaxID=410359 RepID=A3MSY5_PYRCJ|nr:Nre family DNA repair protein [Pyrobaculum calidifontis]ABO07752.1 Protein of unknown function DUF650, N-terminal domain protein [Pyrobaculum calidifontis JCM 11548]
MNICVKCRGRKLLCGLPKCPIEPRARAFHLALRRISGREVFGSTPPSVIVGEFGWPSVRVYLGEPPEVFGEEARRYDDPRLLWGLSLEEISALRSYMAFGVKTARTPWELGELAFVYVSSRPVDVEMRLEKPPVPSLKFDLREKPLGPRAPLESARVVENPSPPRPLESLINDDVSAHEAVVELYSRGVDLYIIQRAFSLGLLGARHRRRLVPSRWGITAVDVAVGNWLAEAVRHFGEVPSPLYGYGEYLDNRYLVVVVPGPLRFVYLERWQQGDRAAEVLVKEDPRGVRSTMDGGFEAARVAVLEKLYAMRRRGSVGIVRWIGEGYYVSVGNWQIRETVRRIQLRPLDEEYKAYVERVGADPLKLLGTSKPLTDFI